MKVKLGSCDTCGETFRLLWSGKIPRHTSPWDARCVCKGSNLPPEAASPVPGRDETTGG